MIKYNDCKQGSIRISVFTLVIVAISFLSGCQLLQKEKSPLDPNNPVSVTLWHYYSGYTKEKFDELVMEFNDTVGVEKGIVIDAKSQGDVKQHEMAVLDAANKKIGAQQNPDIFAAYPDLAYQVDQLVGLVDLRKYLTKEEIDEFRPEFLDEGRLGVENELKIIPLAKSTENIFLNKTFWDKFALETGATLDQLATWEGVIKTAEAYYNWSGGKAFLGIDANANFMLVSAVQLGEELYNYENDEVTFNFNQEVAFKLWNTFYVPYMKGYFGKNTRFSSNDAQIGNVIAYIGSTAGAVYFPYEVTLGASEVIPIESETLPYPQFEQGQPIAVQQGAGMAIRKSGLTHEYAAIEFLKWFTDVEQNVNFAVSTSYFPVKKDALNEEIIVSFLEDQQIETTPAITSSIKTTLEMFKKYKLYNYRPFDGSYRMRLLLEEHLFEKVQDDLERLSELNEAEKSRKLAEFISEENFKKWYDSFMGEAMLIFNR